MVIMICHVAIVDEDKAFDNTQCTAYCQWNVKHGSTMPYRVMTPFQALWNVCDDGIRVVLSTHAITLTILARVVNSVLTNLHAILKVHPQKHYI